MNSAIRLCISCIALLFVGNQLIAQQELDQYLERAVRNNPELKASFNEYLASLERVPQIGALPDPQVMFGIFAQPIETRTGAQRANISVSQAFPWFGTLGAQKDAATMVAKSEYEKFEDSKLRLCNDVKFTYYGLYYLEKSISITKENLDLLETFRQLAQVNFEAGKTGFTDVLRVEMEWEDLNNQLLYLGDSRQVLLAKFQELLNETLDQSVEFPDSLWTDNINIPKDALRDSIMANNKTLRQLDYESLSFENQTAAARKMGMPSFSLGLSYINIDPRTDMDVPGNGRDAIVFPQIGVTLPLYRGKYQSKIKENRLRQEEVDFRKKSTENKLSTELEEAYRDYLNAGRRVSLFRKQSKYADQSLDLLTVEFSTEGENFEDVIRMERRLLNYELELEKARVDQNSIAAYINYLTGH